MERLEKIAIYLDIIVAIIYIVLTAIDKLSPLAGIFIPSELIWGVLIALSISICATIIVYLKQSSDVEKLNGVMGYIFFPKGTPDEDKTLEYHKKHYHKKILVNNRRIPPQAYTLPAAKTCFGWRLINKYPDLWTSVEDTTFPDENVREWCKEQGYTFHPWSATKTELVEGYTSLDRELLDKLKKCRKEGKLDNYRIIFLAKWYQLRTKDYLPYRVLQQYKPPRIYDAPLNTIELIQSGLLDRTTKLKLPFQNLRRWTKWRHYGEYMDRCFTERHLAGEAEVTKP